MNNDGLKDMLSGSYCGDAPQPKRTGPAHLVPVKDDQGRTGSSIFVYYQQPDGSFADRVDIGFSHNHSLAFAVDWDDDGDLDLITAAAGGRKKAEEYGYGQINLMENTGDAGNPVMAYPVNLLKDLKDQPGSVRSAIACDWDNDGDLDLLGVSTLDVVFIERKDGSGPTAFEEPVALLNLYEKELYKENYSHREFCGMCVTDINGDGVLDILVGETLMSNLADETAFENATEEKKKAYWEARIRQSEINRKFLKLFQGEKYRDQTTEENRMYVKIMGEEVMRDEQGEYSKLLMKHPEIRKNSSKYYIWVVPGIKK